MAAVVGQVDIIGDKVYCVVNAGGTLETMNAPKRWWRKLQLALAAQNGKLSVQEVRDFCGKHDGSLPKGQFNV